ncbi:MAG: carbon-phosphorus lyase, partial [Clostridia bacterium]|nr:carbon-phosphorus lyase [Clostridia bacterium]
MKIKYLGTAATEAIPGPFCNCEVCRKARSIGGKEYRSRSQALVNDSLLVDFNADTFMHMFRYGLDLVKIRACLITHIHTDHFYPAEFKNARPDYSEL